MWPFSDDSDESGERPEWRSGRLRHPRARDELNQRRSRIKVVEPLRIGVLGAARIAAAAIVEPAHLTGARLVAVAARDRVRAKAFATEHDVERVLDSYADVLSDAEVEAIYNPLANGLPWNLAAIAAGKHVLTEKPSASDAAEAREVRDAAARAGVVVMEGFRHDDPAAPCRRPAVVVPAGRRRDDGRRLLRKQ